MKQSSIKPEKISFTQVSRLTLHKALLVHQMLHIVLSTVLLRLELLSFAASTWHSQPNAQLPWGAVGCGYEWQLVRNLSMPCPVSAIPKFACITCSTVLTPADCFTQVRQNLRWHKEGFPAWGSHVPGQCGKQPSRQATTA